MVSNAGLLGKQVTPAHQVGEDQFSPNSYWWLFRRLNDWVKGDAVNSLPGCYQERNPLVRARFDALEQAFAEQLPEVLQRAEAAGEHSPDERAQILDRFTEECVQQVLGAVNELTGMDI